jgi:hypothetical protein
MCKDCGCPAGGDDVKIFKVDGKENEQEQDHPHPHSHEHEEKAENEEKKDD